MNLEVLKGIIELGSFLGGLGTLVIALVGSVILAYDLRLRRRQLRETLSRSYAALNVDFQVSIHQKFSRNTFRPEWVLEARLILTNASTEIYAVPAVYVHARPLPEQSDDYGSRTFSEADFGRLEAVGQLSTPKNVARFSSSIWHLGPGEVDSVVRWDVLSDEFVQQYPAVIVWVEVFSVPNEFVGAAYSPDIASDIRCEWTDFMESEDGVRHKKVVFSHALSDAGGIKKGDWIILTPDSDDKDFESSRRFHGVLANLCKTGRQTLAILDNGAKEGLHTEKRRARGPRRTDAAQSRGPAA